MSNGIDFVIGGKDKAQPAMSSVEKSLGRLEQKTESLSKATGGLASMTKNLTAAYASIKAAIVALRGLNEINAAYDQQAGAVKGLEVALKLQGAAVEEQSGKLQAFASDLQAFSGVGDEVTLGLMKQASMLGVQADQLDETAKAAVGLSEATGRSLAESLNLVNNAMAGEFGSFGEIMPQMRQMATEEEKLAAVMDLATKGLEAKAEASQTVEGSSERASNAIGDLMEVVGEIIAPVRVLISSGLTQLAESLQNVLAPAAQWASEVLANIGPIIEWVREKVVAGVNLMIEAFTFFEVILTNLDSVWVMVVAQAELYMLQVSGAIEHALMVQIPAYASWFGENFVNLLKDALNAAVAVVTNGVTNIADAFGALWDHITSMGESDVMGKLGEISGRSYLDGFESSLTNLPDIAGRAISEREQQLQAKVGSIAADLGQQFADKLEGRLLETSGDLGADFASSIDLGMNKALGDNKKKGGGGEPALNVVQSRLLTRGPVDKQADVMDQLLNTVRKVSRGIDDMIGNQSSGNQSLNDIATNTKSRVAVFLPE